MVAWAGCGEAGGRNDKGNGEIWVVISILIMMMVSEVCIYMDQNLSNHTLYICAVYLLYVSYTSITLFGKE